MDEKRHLCNECEFLLLPIMGTLPHKKQKRFKTDKPATTTTTTTTTTPTTATALPHPNMVETIKVETTEEEYISVLFRRLRVFEPIIKGVLEHIKELPKEIDKYVIDERYISTCKEVEAKKGKEVDDTIINSDDFKLDYMSRIIAYRIDACISMMEKSIDRYYFTKQFPGREFDIKNRPVMQFDVQLVHNAFSSLIENGARTYGESLKLLFENIIEQSCAILLGVDTLTKEILQTGEGIDDEKLKFTIRVLNFAKNCLFVRKPHYFEITRRVGGIMDLGVDFKRAYDTAGLYCAFIQTKLYEIHRNREKQKERMA